MSRPPYPTEGLHSLSRDGSNSFGSSANPFYHSYPGVSPPHMYPQINTDNANDVALQTLMRPMTITALAYDPGFELPASTSSSELPSPVEIIIPPSIVTLGYNPGFEMPDTSNSSRCGHPISTCDPDDNDNPYPNISDSRLANISLSYHNPYEQSSSNPDDNNDPVNNDIRGPPPAAGFIFQHPDLPDGIPHPTYYPSLSESAPVLESDDEEASSEEEEIAAVKIYHCRWIGASASSCNVPGAFLVGHDQDGSNIYAGRAYHNGDNIPAKVIPSKNVAYIPYGGQEIIKDQFEMMCAPVYSWQYASGGNIPEGAVEFGSTADGEILYLGRVNHEGSLTPGKVQRSHGCCYFPFNGQEMSAQTYEILILS